MKAIPLTEKRGDRLHRLGKLLNDNGFTQRDIELAYYVEVAEHIARGKTTIEEAVRVVRGNLDKYIAAMEEART